MKRYLTSIFILFFSFIYLNSNAQKLGVIDNKGTRKNINKVTKNNTGNKPSTNVYSGDVYIDELNGEVFIYDGKNSTWEPFTQYWSLKGNSGLTNDNFLGTIDDVKLQLRSENKTILELGKRSTLGLSTSIFGDDPLAHIKNGGSNYSTIQFEAANISSHGKPMIRASDDNFVIRSGIPTDDYFQIRSVANSATDGSLEFEIGDDGNEPFVFKSQNNSLGGKKELFRVQGSNTSTNSKPRFGINTNGAMANSTLQVEGSVSKSIFETTADLTLTEEHHTIVLGGNHAITLPAASSCEGRTYIIRNPINATTTVSSYVDLEGNTETTIFKNSVLKLQSNNTNWLKINNKGNETITSISQSASNTNTQVAANTANTIATYTNENGSNTTINETVTSLSFRTVTGDTTTANTYFIDYLDENGSTNNIEVSGLTYKGTPGSVFFAGTDGTIDENNGQIFWDESSNRLFIGDNESSWPSSISETKVNISGAITARSGFKANNGTAGTPTFRFYNDADTGMFRGSIANNLSFSTGGTEALRIDASQNVGIGTTTPEKKLDVNGEAKIRTLNAGNVTTDNIIVAGTDGVLKNIPVTDIQSEVTITPTASGMASRTTATHSAGGTTTVTNIYETVTVITDTNTATDKKTIAIYQDENGSVSNIQETITDITQAGSNTLVQVNNATPTANTIATYTKEDGDTVTINETVTNITQITSDTITTVTATNVATYNANKDNPKTGDAVYTNEKGNKSKVAVVSSYPNNAIKVGPDGGAYYRGPLVMPIKVVNWNNYPNTSPSSVGYEVEESDYTLIISNVRALVNNARWIGLPDPITSRGRIIIIKNIGPSTLYTNPNFVYTLPTYRFDNEIVSGVSVMLQSDGDRWYKIN